MIRAEDCFFDRIFFSFQVTDEALGVAETADCDTLSVPWVVACGIGYALDSEENVGCGAETFQGASPRFVL